MGEIGLPQNIAGILSSAMAAAVTNAVASTITTASNVCGVDVVDHHEII